MHARSIANVIIKVPVRRLAGLALVTFAAGCQSSLEPGDVLSGRWINSDASLAANQDSVVFQQPCERAVFGPIVLDANRDFTTDSKMLTITGNILHSPDEQLHIQGHFVGDNITLLLYSTGTSGGSDPISITLTPGRSQSPPVCSA